MSTTIEQLELEVQSSVTSAVAQLDALASSLGKVKGATKGGVGLTSVVKQLTTLNTALSSISSANADNLNKMAQGLQAFSTCGNLKLSSSVANQITNLGTAVRSLNGTNYSSLSQLANALTPLSTIGKSNLNSFISQLQRLPQAVQALNSVSMGDLSSKLSELVSAFSQLSNMGKNDLTSFITQLNKIPKLMENLKNVDMRTLYNQIQSLVRVFTPLATQMEKISAGFAAFPTRIQKLITSTNRYSTSANNAATSTKAWSTALQGIKLSSVVYLSKRIGSAIAEYMYGASQWEGIMSRFGRAFGDTAQENYEWIEKLSSKLYIDKQTFMQHSSIFGTMLKGYGVVEKDAATMAMGYTELVYDIWAGYNDIYTSFEDAAIAVRSAIAGEVEPIRKAGFTIVDSQLKITAANYGIAYSSQSASEELKSYLRYLTLVGQANEQGLIGTYAKEMTTAEGLMRMLRQQITSLVQAFGSVFLPILVKVIPYVQAFVSLLNDAIVAVAGLFGVTIQPITFSSGLSSGASAAEDLSNSIGDATKKAKELKNALLGIDELNVISPTEDTSGSGSSGSSGAGGGALDVNSLWDESIFDSVNQQVAELKEKLKDIVPIVAAIGAGLAAWKVANGLIKALERLSTMKGFNIVGSISFKIIGLGLFLDAWNTMKEAIQDIIQNGANFTNVTKLLSGFAEGVAAAFFALGKIKLGGVSLIISGITGIVSDISDMVKNGVNWENANSLVKNIGLFLTGIGAVFTKDYKLTIVGLVLSGVSLILQNLKGLIKGFTTGDFEDVNWIEVASGALMLIGALVLAFKHFEKTHSTFESTKVSETFKKVKNTTSDLSTTTSKLSPKLTSLAKNLGMGIVIVAEVAAAALLITGAIVLLGKGLEQVGESWQPVIENGGTIATAMGIGIGILAGIGVVTYTLGSTGKTLAVNIGIGTLVLAEIGLATGLFLVEIWGIGKGLDEIGQAWQPVFDNGENIATAIGIGTGILVAVGAAAAGLGVASVATVGGLPIAIGIGAGVLWELGVATEVFLKNIQTVGKYLKDVGTAWQPVLDNGETIEQGVLTGTGYLVAIGAAAAALGVAEIASVGLLDVAIDLGAGLLEKLAEAFIRFVNSMIDVANGLGNNLAPALSELNTKLPTLSEDTGKFVDFMEEFANQVWRYTQSSIISGLSATIDTIIGWFTQDPIDKLANDIDNVYNQTRELNDKLRLAVPELQSAVELLKKYRSYLEELENITQYDTQLANGMFVNMKEVGQKLVTGFADGIKSKANDFKNAAKTIVNGFTSTITSESNSSKTNFLKWCSNLKEWFTSSSHGGINPETFQKYAKEMISGFTYGVISNYSSTKSSITTFAATVKDTFLGIVSQESFKGIAKDVVTGFQQGINENYSIVKSSMIVFATSVKNSFQEAVSLNHFKQIGADVVLGFNQGISQNYEKSKTPMGVFAKKAKEWFDEVVSESVFKTIAKDTIDGFNKGLNSFYTTTQPYMKKWANNVKETFKKELDSHSPSKVFEQIGKDTVLGYNIGITNLGGTTKGVVDDWVNSFSSVSPTMSFAVDTSALKYYNSDSFAQSVSADVATRSTVTVTGFKEGMEEFYREYIEPTLSQMADDMRRQADKQEKTVVQIGNRVVNDAVTTQKKANGYVFAK